MMTNATTAITVAKSIFRYVADESDKLNSENISVALFPSKAADACGYPVAAIAAEADAAALLAPVNVVPTKIIEMNQKIKAHATVRPAMTV